MNYFLYFIDSMVRVSHSGGRAILKCLLMQNYPASLCKYGSLQQSCGP